MWNKSLMEVVDRLISLITDSAPSTSESTNCYNYLNQIRLLTLMSHLIVKATICKSDLCLSWFVKSNGLARFIHFSLFFSVIKDAVVCLQLMRIS